MVMMNRDNFYHVLHFDVMLYGMYQRTLHYRHLPNIPLDEGELRAFVLEKMPTLKNKPFTIEF